MSKFTIRGYREGDEVPIMKLRSLVFNDSKGMDWWIWQHKQNPAGQAYINVAELQDEGKIIGHECYVPLRIKIGDSTGVIAVSVDNMVHPDYRGLGVYKQVRKKARELRHQNRFDFIYNFNNEIAYRINLTMGTKLLYEKAPRWIKPLDIKKFIQRYFTKSRLVAHLFTPIGNVVIKLSDRSGTSPIHTKVREVKEIDDRFDDLWQQASFLHPIMLVRDRAYLDWRYVKKPDASYTIYISEQDGQLLGFIVLKVARNNGLQMGWIADVLTHSKDTPAISDLIAKAIQHFKMVGADIISCTLPLKTYLTSSLRRFGFLFASRWQRGINPITISPITSVYPVSFLLNPNNWFITRGDSDLI